MGEPRSTLATTLNHLLETAIGLASDVLEQRGDRAARAVAVQQLDQQLTALQAEVEAAPDRSDIEPIWWEIKRNLIFLQAMATPVVQSNDPNEAARQLNAEVYNLIVQMIAAGQLDRAITADGDPWTRQAEKLMARLSALTQDQSAGLTPDSRRRASEALLEIRFVLKGGHGVTSPRVAQLMREAQAGNSEAT